LSEQLSELADLTRTAGGEVVGKEVQRRSEVDPALFIGKGKVEELKALREANAYDLLICNEDLSPRQQRNLEKELKTRVVDRTELILDIFAQHARTHEGRLQVETAQLHHLLPRLIGAWDYHRQGGGIGTRGGPGEQQMRGRAAAHPAAAERPREGDHRGSAPARPAEGGPPSLRAADGRHRRLHERRQVAAAQRPDGRRRAG